MTDTNLITCQTPVSQSLKMYTCDTYLCAVVFRTLTEPQDTVV